MPTTFNYMSWNIKQLAQKKEKDVFGVTDVQGIGNIIINSGADIVSVLEVMRGTGWIGLSQILQHLQSQDPSSKWATMATSFNAPGNSKPDSNGIFWKESKIWFDGFTWPDMGPNGTTIRFYNRNPALFRFKGGGPSGQPFNIITIHSPEPSEARGQAPIWTMQQLAALDSVSNQSVPTIIAGDFNINYSSATAGYYQLVANSGYTILFTKGQRTSLKMTVDTSTGQYTANAYDNIFIGKNSIPTPSAQNPIVGDFIEPFAASQGLVPYKAQDADQWQQILSLVRSRISDHFPVFVTITF